MKIVIFRHAEKSSTSGLNPPLSKTGLRQSEVLLQLVQEKNLPKPQRLFCSPKLRTIQTFENLATWLNVNPEVQHYLEERQQSETLNQFRERCSKGLTEIAQVAKESCLFVCSHMDWIEEALTLIPTEEDILKPELSTWVSGQYAQFDCDGKLWNYLGTGKVKP